MFFKKKIKCPYCNEILEKKPSRKTKCPFCKKYIYVKSDKLVTEEEAKAIEQKWKFIHELKDLGISEGDYNNQKKSLTIKKGFEPKHVDIIWDLLNKKTMELAKNKDFNGLKMLYYQMALFLNEKGKNFFHVLQQSRKMELESLRIMGIKKVIIISSDGCSSCKELNDKILTIKEALKTMPIPNKNCSYKLYNGKSGFCRCMYNATGFRK